MYLCKFCGKECKNAKGISIHLIRAHNIKPQTYYDKFFKKINEDVCNNESCSKLTTFYNIRLGYANYCSLICANTSKIRKLQEKQRMSKKYKNKHERIKTGKLVKKAFEDSNKRKHISDGIKRAYKNNPELRKNASEHSKKLWNNEKIRKVMVKNMREKCRTEKHRENQRKIALQFSKNPGWRKNVSEGTIKGWAKVPEKKEQQRQYMINGGAANCNRFIKNPSKPQIALFKLCQKLLPYPIMNYPCKGYSIDIAIPQLNLAIEYDGSYWHQDKEYDKNRQNELEQEGWNFLRYIDKVPKEEHLFNDINKKSNINKGN